MEFIEKQDYSEIKKFCKDLEERKYVFYRGTKVDYLLPSIVPLKNNLDIAHLLQIEKKILKRFKNIYPYKFNCDEITKDWLYRKRAREHELASRMFDWSHVFYKALDFTTKYLQSSDEFGYFWILQMERDEIITYANFKSYPIESISSTLLLRTVKYEEGEKELAPHRQFVQGGNFLIQPPYLLTTHLNKQPLFRDRLICLKIPSYCAKKIRQDIVKYEHEDLNQDLMIEKDNCIDKKCKCLNEIYLHSVSNIVQEYNKKLNL